MRGRDHAPARPRCDRPRLERLLRPASSRVRDRPACTAGASDGDSGGARRAPPCAASCPRRRGRRATRAARTRQAARAPKSPAARRARHGARPGRSRAARSARSRAAWGDGGAEHVLDLVPAVAASAEALRGRPHLGRIIIGELRRDDLVDRRCSRGFTSRPSTITVSASVSSSGWAARISSARSSGSAGSSARVASSGSGDRWDAERQANVAVLVDGRRSLERFVLRRRRAAQLEHARVVGRLGGGAFAQRQPHAPLVAEIEHVPDPLAAAEAEFGDRDIGGARRPRPA